MSSQPWGRDFLTTDVIAGEAEEEAPDEMQKAIARAQALYASGRSGGSGFSVYPRRARKATTGEEDAQGTPSIFFSL